MKSTAPSSHEIKDSNMSCGAGPYEVHVHSAMTLGCARDTLCRPKLRRANHPVMLVELVHFIDYVPKVQVTAYRFRMR